MSEVDCWRRYQMTGSHIRYRDQKARSATATQLAQGKTAVQHAAVYKVQLVIILSSVRFRGPVLLLLFLLTWSK